jgi:hypothetical protein
MAKTTDPGFHKRIGQIGGYITASRIDVSERARKGQQGLFEKFLAEQDTNLDGDERARRARTAMAAHFAKIRLKANAARRKGAPS